MVKKIRTKGMKTRKNIRRKGMIRYFAYGFNTNKEEFLLRVPPAIYVGKACLPNYEFVMRDYANIVPNKKEKVWGVLWDVPVNWIPDLNEIEAEYEQKIVYVNLRDTKTKAMVYVMVDEEVGIPTERYVTGVSKGYMENKLPLRQIKRAL